MNRSVLRLVAAGVVLAGLGLVAWRWRANLTGVERPPVSAVQPAAGSQSSPPAVAATAVAPATLVATAVDQAAADKAARVAKILRDYEEIQAKMLADSTNAGPGSTAAVGALLRRLALLDQERRRDLAGVMTPRELEDYEIRETAAGQKMRATLDGTAATDEQRRGVFRIEQAFNDEYGFTFDLSAGALRTREVARQAAQEKERATLGDGLFVTWLRGTDPGFPHFLELAQQQNLLVDAALAIWGVKNKFTVNALEIRSMPPESGSAARAALLEWARTQLSTVAGSLPAEVVDRELADWAPPAKP